ncbi:hypothetical protein HDU98_007963 [Podochytrium sp. JEL0797]|nr:hypothetical protein HDU98_007963 [Podochytrium sp. JEL0797]
MFAVAALSVLQQHRPSIDTALRLYAVRIQKQCVEKHAGLSIFCPSPTELTLCGNAFVIDVRDLTSAVETRIIETLCASLSQITLDPKLGHIAKVKLSYVENGAQVYDNEGGLFLERQLKESTFAPFEASIRTLATLDKFTTPTLDAYKLFRTLQNDLSRMYQRELKHALDGSDQMSSETWAFGIHPLVAVLLHGHGVFLRNWRQLGPAVVYWVGRGDVVGEEGWESVVGNEASRLAEFEEVYSVHFGFDEGSALNLLDSVDSGYLLDDGTHAVQQLSIDTISSITSLNGLELSFRKSTNPPPPDFTTCFTLEFDPPVVCSQVYLDTILAITGDSTPMDTSTTTPTKQPTYLDSLLPPHYTFAKPSEWKYTRLLHTREAYSKLGFSGATLAVPRGEIETVRVGHPDRILEVLQGVRRQVVFNTIVGSLFSAGPEDGAGVAKMFAVVDVDFLPPESISLSVAVLGSGVVGIRVVVEKESNMPKVEVVVGECDVEGVEKVLQGTLDLSLALLCLKKK